MKFHINSIPLFYLLIPFWLLSSLQSSFSQKINDSTSYFYKAITAPELPENLAQGLNFYTNKKQKDLAKNDTLSVIRSLRMLAIGDFKLGNYYDSENHIVEALELVDRMTFKDTLIDAKIGLYNQLGRIYNASSNPIAAVKAFDMALAITKKTKDSLIILNNKANTFMTQLDYKKAIEMYSLLHDKSLKIQDSLQIALVLDNLGDAQSRTGSMGALSNLLSALKIRKQRNYLAGLYSSYKNLSAHYRREKKSEKAKSYADTALQISKEINSSSYKLDALSYFIKTNDDPHVRAYKILADSIANAKQIAENKNAFLKYNVTSEQKKTQASLLSKEIESRKKLLYQFLTLLVLIILIASFFIFRYRYRKVKIEEVYKTENRISKKVHDEVANDIYKVMTSLENNPNKTDIIVDQLEKIYSKTRDISRENSAIDLQQNFGQQLNDLLLGYKNEQVTVVTRNLSKIDWMKVSESKKTIIYRVLQELMTNMRKHSKATSVALVFTQTKSKLAIKYSDNGIGCDLNKQNGLQNTESRIASIKGTINFESKKDAGFKATILI